MPTRTSNLHNPKETLALKPILPTQFWTFGNALSLLKSCQDPYILNALDEFLLFNRQLLMNASPFELKDSQQTLADDLKEVTLRTISYSVLQSNNIKDAKKTNAILGNLDVKEVLRIIVQTSKKVPERKIYDFEKLKSKLPDDREKYLESERILMYVNKILRERRIILKIVIELLNNKSNSFASSTIQNLGKELFLSKTYISSIIDSIKNSLAFIVNQPYQDDVSQNLNDLIVRETVLFVIDLCKVLIELTIQNPVIDNEITKQWFEFMGQNNFIANLAPYFKVQESFNLTQTLCTLISILFLDLENAFDHQNLITGNESSPETLNFMGDLTTFKALNSLISNPENSNSIILYGWSIILLRKLYFIQEVPKDPISAEFTKSFPAEEINFHINDLNARCVKLNVFEEINTLNESLKFDNLYSAILSTVLISALPLITLTPQVSRTVANVIKNCPNSVIEKFFENESFVNQIILSRAKFPVLLTPYLKLCAINGNFAYHEFNELKSFIQVFKKDHFEQLYKIDDENSDLVVLKSSIDVYPPFEAAKKLSLVLPEGTKAKILPTTSEDEILVTFLYKYNGWSFLGRIVQNISRSFNDQDEDKLDFIINVSDVLAKVAQDTDHISSVLESMSTYTDNSDIIEVLLRIFEQSLHSRKTQILESILGLLTHLTPQFSHRIWPYLSKSSLLSRNGKEGFITTIFGSIEMISGEYSFTISLIKFIDGLVQSCLTLKEDYPTKSKSMILMKFVNHLISIFESFTHCKFIKSYQKMEIGVLILDIFSNILASIYGVKKTTSDNKVTAVLNEVSVTILDTFLITKNEYSRSSLPIFLMIESLSSNLSVYELYDLSGFWYENWIRCGLSFSQLIISIRSLIEYKPSSFEREFFKKLPQLISTYSQYEPLRKDIIDVITILAKGTWEEQNKPSLLGHLGNDYSRVLLSCLIADLDNSLDDYRLKVSLYDFICSVLEGNQEGLAVLFSGRDVFGRSKEVEADDPTNKKGSLLSILKKNVKEIKYYPNSVSIHLLDALSLSYNSWNTIKENDEDCEFIDELINRIQLSLNDQPKSLDDYISKCYEQKIISKIAEILSLILFTTRNEQVKQKIKALIVSDKFIDIVKDKFIIKDYNPVLHSKVNELFEQFAPNLRLDQFTTTLGKRNRYGVSNVFNISLMDGLFGGNPKWPALRAQIMESSINIQYLSSQASITKSLGALLTVFCRRFSSSLTPNMLDLVHHLLKINYIEGIPSNLFDLIYQERIEVAFYLIYSMTHESGIKKQSKQIFEIIKVSLDLLSSSSLKFLASLSASSGNYKQLLRIIYCCLLISKDDEEILIEYFSVFKDLFDLIITKGTQVLLIDIQNEVYLQRNKGQIASSNGVRGVFSVETLHSKTDDLMLILSILKLYMGMNSSRNMKLEMARLINDNGTINALLSLYSLSHTIEVNDEHIFAQLSLMFIQELMTVELIAEKFISSGLYVVLVESPISTQIRAGGLSVTSGNQYHKLWINGILPIFIISLNKLGLSVIKEVCLGLQMFGKQIESCIESWSRDSSSIKITSSTVIETSQILLLYESLQSMNVEQFMRDQDLSHLKILPGLDTEGKRDEFIDYINNLLKHPKFLTSRVLPSSIDEQRIIEKGGVGYEKFVNNLIEEIRDLKEFLI
ncbi:uncharacterized protein CANTADRAFT_97093 [Suhomyces tanzawaensis NRRL Y-17324]|uniref:Nucleoporin NUP188 n=1 Tax=Suhomyces tanzawaensis NRRL Y-17324 TaxID=984487 RepID=A0A1E4SDG3_9ASCO|nr:uncharacterized protein CANTADRAFT_97093 [Suhomyces tanzawaensis NRRL Y-17324]ODV77432.1 hypothetical protein CANTADRAFT_97093 [Suhomyces tanzawaensis NRRL Y-17324]